MYVLRFSHSIQFSSCDVSYVAGNWEIRKKVNEIEKLKKKENKKW